MIWMHVFLCGLGLLSEPGFYPAMAAQDSGKKDTSVVSQDIVIRGKARKAPAVGPPPPPSPRPVADEVIRSLDLYKSKLDIPAASVNMPASVKRPVLPFPAPPFLAFSVDSFPHPYTRWMFEVLTRDSIVWRVEGEEPPTSALVWDGTGASGAFAARVGTPYHFRFTGSGGGGEYAAVSEPIELDSLAFREALGSRRLEVSNALLFASRRAAFVKGASAYLSEMAGRLRASRLGSDSYRFLLYQKDPASELARSRARALALYFSKELLINPAKINIEIASVGNRGDVTACILPPEEGDTLRLRGE